MAAFSVAIWVLVAEVRQMGFANILIQFKSIPTSNLLLAFALTVCSYTILTCYDLLAFRYLGEKIGYRTIAPIAFSAFAIGHNVGVASLSGGAVRFRAYSLFGIATTNITALIAFIPITFFLGASASLGIVLVLEPENALSSIPIGAFELRLIGVLLFLTVIAYLAFLTLHSKAVRIGPWHFNLPSIKIGIGQVALSSLDIIVESLILYVLLKAAIDISYLVVLGAFILAVFFALVSSVPGGLGVFEGALILLLPEIPVSVLLGAVIAYRLIYYLIPLLFAASLIVFREVREQKLKIQELSQSSLQWAGHLVPQTFGAVVFIVGAYLLVRGSMPLNLTATQVTEAVIPPQLLELSHLVSSVVGAALLLVARGLYRRLYRAWFTTIVLLITAILTTIAQFHSWPHLVFLALLLMLVWHSQKEFYRGRALVDQPFNSSWVSSIALVMIATVGIGLIANENIQYSNDLWWQFSLDGEASRMLRAALFAFVLLGGFALTKFLHQGSAPNDKEMGDDVAAIKHLVLIDERAASNVALLGDKWFLIHPSGDAFIMYQISGGSWIALGDPIGNKDRFEEVLWQFREACDTNSARCVLYQVSDKHLSLYLDLGLSLLKLGEEGNVDISNFSLEGSLRAELRQACSKAKRSGAEFSVIPAAELPHIMDQLARVSDAWLHGKSTKEKGFSLGFFDPQYLSNFDCALVTIDNEIVAFANLWKGGTGVELSLDLMRYSDKAPKGIMDYLFTEVMLWGKDNGYAEFSLGMAPLSGLEHHVLASTWHKVGNLIFRFGDNFYNFEGLRQYKEKFQPNWEPRYLACKGGLTIPSAFIDTTVLISGGISGILTK